jgi:hypothetical protein
MISSSTVLTLLNDAVDRSGRAVINGRIDVELPVYPIPLEENPLNIYLVCVGPVGIQFILEINTIVHITIPRLNGNGSSPTSNHPAWHPETSLRPCILGYSILQQLGYNSRPGST